MEILVNTNLNSIKKGISDCQPVIRFPREKHERVFLSKAQQTNDFNFFQISKTAWKFYLKKKRIGNKIPSFLLIIGKFSLNCIKYLESFESPSLF